MRFLVCWIVAAALAVGLSGTGPPSAVRAQASAPREPAGQEPTTSSTSAPEAKETEEGEVSPSEEGADDPLEVFVPSEKVPADSAISFPVDI